MRYAVHVESAPGTWTVSFESESIREAADHAKLAAVGHPPDDPGRRVEVVDGSLGRTVFRAHGAEWRWVTR